MLKKYYYLTKPGIIYGNSLTVIAGYLYASRWNDFWLVIPTIIGVGLVIGSACVFNNIIDRDIDAKMERTKKRALVTNSISTRSAAIYGVFIGLAGIAVLSIFTNLITVLIGLVGFVDYVFFYSFSKPKTRHATLIGSVSGATPLVAGYTAYANHLGVEALLLFAIMTFWQMPHFFGIALRRSGEYAKAKIPVLPLVKNRQYTKQQIVAYIVLFMISCILLGIYGSAGIVFAVGMSVLSIWWLAIAIPGLSMQKDKAWAKKLFMYSLYVLLAMSALLSVSGLIN